MFGRWNSGNSFRIVAVSVLTVTALSCSGSTSPVPGEADSQESKESCATTYDCYSEIQDRFCLNGECVEPIECESTEDCPAELRHCTCTTVGCTGRDGRIQLHCTSRQESTCDFVQAFIAYSSVHGCYGRKILASTDCDGFIPRDTYVDCTECLDDHAGACSEDFNVCSCNDDGKSTAR